MQLWNQIVEKIVKLKWLHRNFVNVKSVAGNQIRENGQNKKIVTVKKVDGSIRKSYIDEIMN